MARWGEGDPRWIVEERPDATNVNNWHWTEKNACGWSKDKLNELLVGLKINSDVALVKLESMDKIEGEAVANNRKGKLIFFYEWDMTLSWKGQLVGGSTEYEGKLQIPNLSEENDVSEVEVQVTLKESSTEGQIIKDFLHRQGCKKVREQLQQYILGLKEANQYVVVGLGIRTCKCDTSASYPGPLQHTEFSKGMILPKKDTEEQKEQVNNLSVGFATKVQMNNYTRSEGNKKAANLETDVLHASHSFQCRGEDFFRAMTTSEMVSAFTNGPCLIEPKAGGRFELFNKNIYGEFVELIPAKKIVQRWRLKDWPDTHFSTVIMDIDQQEDHTVVKITQIGIPKSEMDVTKENWGRYYWDAIKRTFGWGYFM